MGFYGFRYNEETSGFGKPNRLNACNCIISCTPFFFAYILFPACRHYFFKYFGSSYTSSYCDSGYNEEKD